MLSLPEYSRFAISLFAVLGPVTAVPAFLSHTEGLTGVVPLGFPLLAGPGSISSVIVAIRDGSGFAHAAAVIVCVLATCAMVWVVLRAAHPIATRLGRGGLNAASRFFAFLLACIAVEFITDGVRSLFPVFG